MKFTEKQKIDFCKQQDFTGILNFCTDKECLACYNKIVHNYRTIVREKKDNIVETLDNKYRILQARLIYRYGRKLGCAKWRNVLYYVIEKRNKF